jgi:6-phospho-3-hexuloisomerase
LSISKGVKEEIKRMLDWMSKQELDDRQIEEVVKEILNTQDEKGKNLKKIFINGLGRSGFVADGFAMRLSHLGFNARTLKEPTAPPVEKGDLFIVLSGSGASLISQIEIALKIGAKVIVITSLADSVGARLGDIKFIIPGREKEAEGSSLSYDERQMRGIPIFPLGTAFEDFAMIVLDAIISQLILIKKKSEKDLKEQHINIQEM